MEDGCHDARKIMRQPEGQVKSRFSAGAGGYPKKVCWRAAG
jgi:hypothetical protein